jgi:hypothetical protein
MHVSGTFDKNQAVVAMWVYCWIFSSIGLRVCFCASTMTFCFNSSEVYSSKSNVTLPALLSLLRTALAIQNLLCFHMNFNIVFPTSVKKVIGILMENTFGNIVIFTIFC